MELSMIGRGAPGFAEKVLSALRFEVAVNQDNAPTLDGGA
jgi:hypothetical protein